MGVGWDSVLEEEEVPKGVQKGATCTEGETEMSGVRRPRVPRTGWEEE